METQINLLEWVKKFDQGEFKNPSVEVQISAGWYDWFCRETSLARKTQNLGRKLKQIINSPKLNPKRQYVFFKNNCPLSGNLYDDFRICDIISGDVIFTITPSSGHKSAQGRGDVWGKENNFKEPLITGSWAEIKKWFNL